MGEDDSKLGEKNFPTDPPKELSDSELEILLTDYKTAAEDSRYRDELLHYTYYVSIVALSLLASAFLTFYKEPQTGTLEYIITGLGGALIFTILFFWADSFHKARNSSWDRQHDIEKYLSEDYPGSLESNYRVKERDRDWSDRRSVAPAVKYGLLLVVFSNIIIVIINACSLFAG